MSLADDRPYQSYPPSLWGGGSGAKDPHIDSITPAAGVVGVEAVVSVLGSNFEATSVVEIDQVAVGATAFVSATELSLTVTPAIAGVKSVTVRNANEEESNSVDFTVSAAEEDPEPEAEAAPKARRRRSSG